MCDNNNVQGGGHSARSYWKRHGDVTAVLKVEIF
jgi:hypothetical protein